MEPLARMILVSSLLLAAYGLITRRLFVSRGVEDLGEPGAIHRALYLVAGSSVLVTALLTALEVPAWKWVLCFALLAMVGYSATAPKPSSY